MNLKRCCRDNKYVGFMALAMNSHTLSVNRGSYCLRCPVAFTIFAFYAEEAFNIQLSTGPGFKAYSLL